MEELNAQDEEKNQTMTIFFNLSKKSELDSKSTRFLNATIQKEPSFLRHTLDPATTTELSFRIGVVSRST